MLAPKLIAVDWGTTNFRAYLVAHNAKVLGVRRFRRGILHIKSSHFLKTFEKLLSKWLFTYPDIPILMAGMVGSQQGWQEVPYLQCPLLLSTLGRGIKKISTMRAIFIIPGLMCEREGRIDFMRGEETQMLGAVQDSDCSVFCMPGTHSKWVRMEQGRLSYFSTYMTGELFALLSTQSILAKQICVSDQIDWDAFDQGVNMAISGPAQWLSDLFQVRSRMLAKQLSRSSVLDYLSGLLTGYEILQAHPYWEAAEPIVIIAGDLISDRYQRVMNKMGMVCSVVDVSRATVMGLWYLAKQEKIIC